MPALDDTPAGCLTCTVPDLLGLQLSRESQPALRLQPLSSPAVSGMTRAGWASQCIALALLVCTGAGTGGDGQMQAEAQSGCAQDDAACFRALAEARLQRIRQLEARLASCKAASTVDRALPDCQQRDDARAPGDASCASPGALRSEEPWLAVAGLYNDDMSTWYKEAIRSIEHYNRFGTDAWSPKGQAVFERLWNPPLHTGPDTAERFACVRVCARVRACACERAIVSKLCLVGV